MAVSESEDLLIENCESTRTHPIRLSEHLGSGVAIGVLNLIIKTKLFFAIFWSLKFKLQDIYWAVPYTIQSVCVHFELLFSKKN